MTLIDKPEQITTGETIVFTCFGEADQGVVSWAREIGGRTTLRTRDGQVTLAVSTANGTFEWADGITRVERPSGRIAELEAKVAEQQRTIATLRTDRAAFEKSVGTKAVELAREHDWCEVVSEALAELGIPEPDPRREVHVSVDLVFRGIPSTFDPTEDWIQKSILVDGGDSAISNGQRFEIELDNDWENVEVVVPIHGTAATVHEVTSVD